MKNCTGIYLQGENNYYEQKKQIYGENIGTSGGHAIGEKIYLDAKTKYSNGERTIDIIRDNITHELWHVFDYTKGTDEYYLSELEFNVLYNQNPNSITEYGAKNNLEFFAEAGTMYLLSPEELKEKNMDVYNYFESLPKE